jgi:hypothetical protein
VKRVINHIYEIKFVPADFVTTEVHEFVTDPGEVARYKKAINEQGGESYDPALRPKLVIIDHGPWKRAKKP